MAGTESQIEGRIVAYVQDMVGRNEMPTRFNAIRQVTGDLDVLPSAVAKVITKMIEGGSLKHVTNDQLRLVPRAETPAAEPAAAPAPPAAPAGGKGKKKG